MIPIKDNYKSWCAIKHNQTKRNANMKNETMIAM